MGGKHKNVQRTKNNARPSSSGRSAELLASSINSYVGFSCVKDGGPVLPGFSSTTTTNVDELNMNITADFQVLLKKMNKKDAKTKLKALQEFIELLENSDAESARAVLPFWPRMYVSLAVDVEHRVREASHYAHRALVLKVGRNLAPYLKQLAGPWFTSQYDTYAPAASAATNSFQDVFPGPKGQEAIGFCQDDILHYICDNITVQTVNTLVTSKNLSTEEAEAKYERLLICSLQGYKFYLNKLPKERILCAEQLNRNIISNAKFWKLGKSKVAGVRAAFFGCLSALCQHTPFFITDDLKRITSLIFTSLDETDSSVLHSVWEAALLLVSNVPDCWNYINVEKVVCPKLWNVLKNAAHGVAISVFPNLLPFLAHLPMTTIDYSSLYNSLFENLIKGLQRRQVLQSRAEFNIIVCTFMECLQYAILKHGQDYKFVENLINTYLLPIIEWCILGEEIPLKPIYNEFAIIVHNWERNTKKTKLLECLWCGLNEIMCRIANKDTIHEYVSNRQVELLLYIKRGALQRSRKQVNVTFATLDDEQTSKSIPSLNIQSSSSSSNTEISHECVPLARLKKLVYDVASIYLQIIIQDERVHLISSLCILVQQFDNIELFQHLEKKDSDTSNTSLFTLHNNIFKLLLNKENTCSESLIDIIFTYYKYIDEDKKLLVLESLCDENNMDKLFWGVAKALSHPYCNDVIIKKWLKTTPVNELFEASAKSMIHGSISVERRLLLKKVLNQTSDGELYISSKACFTIISIICQAIMKPENYLQTLDECASFAAELAATIYTECTLFQYGHELFIALFALSCNTRLDSDSLSNDTAWEVNTACQDILSLIFKERLYNIWDELLPKLKYFIHKELTESINSNSLIRLTNVVRYMTCTVVQHEKKEDDEEEKDTEINSMKEKKKLRSLHVLRDILLPSDDVSHILQKLKDLCNSALILHGHVSFINDNAISDSLYIDSLQQIHFINYLHWHRFLIYSLSELLDSEVKQSLQEYLAEFIIYARYSNAIATLFVKYYKMTKAYKEINDMLDNVQNVYIEKIANFDINIKYIHEINHILYVSYMEPLTSKCNMIDVYNDLLKNSKSDGNIVQLSQLFSKYLNFNNIPVVKENIHILAIIRALMYSNKNDMKVMEGLNAALEIQQNDHINLLYKQNINWCKWKDIHGAVELARFLGATIKYTPHLMQDKHRDLLITSISAWITSIEKSKHIYDKPIVTCFICAVCDVYTTFYDYIHNTKDLDEGWLKTANEYHQLFSKDIKKSLLDIWTYIVTNELNKKELTMSYQIALEVIGSISIRLEWEKTYNKSIDKIIELCSDLLKSPCITLQLWGYHGLRRLINEMLNVYVLNKYLTTILRIMQDVVNAMLMDYRVGDDSCRVEPFTDSYTYTFGYLILWDVFIELCERAPTDFRYTYSEWLHSEGYLTQFLDHIFKLMPAEVLNCTEGRKTNLVDYFMIAPSLDMGHQSTSELLERLVCWLYGRIVSILPRLVRQWWTNAEQKSAQLIEQVTVAYVSPMVCANQLQEVAERERERERDGDGDGDGECDNNGISRNMRIKVHSSAREVLATYTIDETRMELHIMLPTNYPLGVVQVSCNKQLGNNPPFRNWLMQLTILLTHQNGRIWEGLSLWNNSLDKKFYGVEQCYICFAVLNHSTSQLPKLSCQTCKKKFHSNCMYKWFSTSNKSTCPICRNFF